MAWFVPRDDGTFYDIFGKIRTLEQQEFFRNTPPVTGIVVDAGVIGGKTYIATYDLETRIYKIDRFPFKHHSAVAELMAIAKGVSAAKWKEDPVCVHCDNSQAVIWAIKRYSMDPREYQYIDVMAYNCAMQVIFGKSSSIKIRPWYTNNWGENPADYRYRKNTDGFRGFVRPKQKEGDPPRKKVRRRRRRKKKEEG